MFWFNASDCRLRSSPLIGYREIASREFHARVEKIDLERLSRPPSIASIVARNSHQPLHARRRSEFASVRINFTCNRAAPKHRIASCVNAALGICKISWCPKDKKQSLPRNKRLLPIYCFKCFQEHILMNSLAVKGKR